MRKISPAHLPDHGFTLVEMLVVVALLGALAVGLLAAIDPVEKLKRGRDEALRGISQTFYNGILDYYKSYSQMPFSTSFTGSAMTSTAVDNVIVLLLGNNSLKSTFTAIEPAQETSIRVTTDTATNSISICYRPESKGQKLDASTIYNAAGITAGPGAFCGTSSSTCYYCIK